MLLQVKLWERQPGKYFCLSTKSASGSWKDHWFSRSQIKKIGAFISQNLDKDMYACPHGFSEKKRQKPYAVEPLLLYSDLDEVNPNDIELRPTIALESSPGRYVGYWLTDEAASEQLNRRLAYSIDADISGWDRTQVLRVPNTRNYKYESAPRVRILWSDGPEYSLAELERKIPALKSARGEEISEDAARVFKRYEKKLPRWVRRELLHGKPEQGKRSEVLWKLQNELLEVGMSRNEAFDLLWVCPWNKFKNRRDGVDQLWRELDKSLEQHFEGWSASRDGEEDPLSFNPLPRSMADVEIENIDWITPGWFARKELTIVEGDPGLGKSYFMQMVSLLICDGKPIPSEERVKPIQGRVAYFDMENTAGSVTKVRLVENGMECFENYWQGEEPFSIDDEERWSRVADVLEDFRPTMVVFDTVNVYIGAADMHRASETQQALSNFKQLAVRFNCCVVILRHLTKGGKEKALYRGQGSIAMTGIARIVLTVGQSPDDADTRVVACTKNNISKKPRALTYRIDALPDRNGQTNRSKLVWGDFVDLTSDDIVSVSTPKKSNDKENAMQWLKEQLENGKVEIARIERMAEARSISRSTLNRAASDLSVVKSLVGFGPAKQSFWALPEGDEAPSEGAPKRRGRQPERSKSRGTTRRISFGR